MAENLYGDFRDFEARARRILGDAQEALASARQTARQVGDARIIAPQDPGRRPVGGAAPRGGAGAVNAETAALRQNLTALNQVTAARQRYVRVLQEQTRLQSRTGRAPVAGAFVPPPGYRTERGLAVPPQRRTFGTDRAAVQSETNYRQALQNTLRSVNQLSSAQQRLAIFRARSPRGALPAAGQSGYQPPGPNAPTQFRTARIGNTGAAGEAAQQNRLAGAVARARLEAQRSSVSWQSASQSMTRHGAATTEAIRAAARGEITVRELGSQVGLTAAKFGVWTAASVGVFGALGTVARAGRGAIQGLSGVNEVARYITSGLDTSRLQSQFRELSSTFNLPVEDVTSAFAQMSRVFHDQEGAAKGAAASLLLMRVGGLEAAQSTRYLTAIMTGFALPASQAATVVDQLNQAQNRFNVDIASGAAGIARAAGAVRAAGGDYSTLVALMTTAQRATGATGDVVGTALRRSAGFIQRPQNQQKLRGYGVDPSKGFNETYNQAFGLVQSGAVRGPDIIGLATALSSPQLGVSVIAPLLQNWRLYQKVLQDTSPAASQGSAQRELANILSEAQEQISAIGNALERLGAGLAQAGFLTPFIGLIKVINLAIDGVTFLADAFGKIPSPIREIIAGMTQVYGLVRVLRHFGVGEGSQGGLGRLVAGDPSRAEVRRIRDAAGGNVERLRGVNEQEAAHTFGLRQAATTQAIAVQQAPTVEGQKKLASLEREALAASKQQQITLGELQIAEQRQLEARRAMGSKTRRQAFLAQEEARGTFVRSDYTVGSSARPRGVRAVPVVGAHGEQATAGGLNLTELHDVEALAGGRGQFGGSGTGGVAQRAAEAQKKLSRQALREAGGWRGFVASNAVLYGGFRAYESTIGRVTSNLGGRGGIVGAARRGASAAAGAIGRVASSLAGFIGPVDLFLIGLIAFLEAKAAIDEGLKRHDDRIKRLNRPAGQETLEERRKSIENANKELKRPSTNTESLASFFDQAKDTIAPNVRHDPDHRDLAEERRRAARRARDVRENRNLEVAFRTRDALPVKAPNVEEADQGMAAIIKAYRDRRISLGQFVRRADAQIREVERSPNIPGPQRRITASRIASQSLDATSSGFIRQYRLLQRLLPEQLNQRLENFQKLFESGQGTGSDRRQYTATLFQRLGKFNLRSPGDRAAYQDQIQSYTKASTQHLSDRFQRLLRNARSDRQIDRAMDVYDRERGRLLRAPGGEVTRRRRYVQQQGHTLSTQIVTRQKQQKEIEDELRQTDGKGDQGLFGGRQFTGGLRRGALQQRLAAIKQEIASLKGQKKGNDEALKKAKRDERNVSRELRQQLPETDEERFGEFQQRYDATTQFKQSQVRSPEGKNRIAISRGRKLLAQARRRHASPEQVLAIQTQVNDAVNEAADANDQKLQDRLNKMELQGRLSEARAKTDRGKFLARARSITRRLHVAKTPEDRLNLLIERAENQQQEEERRRNEKKEQIQARGEILKAQTRDPVREAQIDVSIARQILRLAHGATERLQARAQLMQALEALGEARNQARRDSVEARYDYKKSLSDNPVYQARVDVQQARAMLSLARTASERLHARADINRAQLALAQAIREDRRERLSAYYEYLVSTTENPVTQARYQLRLAERLLVLAHTTAERYRALAEINRRRLELRDAVSNEAIEDVHHRVNIGKLTTDQEIQALTRILHTYKLGRQTRRQLEEEIYRLKKEGENQDYDLNPGDVRLPTIYDIRRAVAGGAAGGRVNMNVTNAPQVTLNVQPGGEAEVGRVLDNTLQTSTGAAMRNAGL